MLAIGLATLVVGDHTMYRSQLRGRADSPGHRFRMALPLMASLPARDAAHSPRLVLTGAQTIDQATHELTRFKLLGAPVVDDQGTLLGSADLAALQAAVAEGEDGSRPLRAASARLGEVAIAADDPLDDALGLLVDAGREWCPVEEDGRYIGVVTTRDVLTSYRRALAGNVRRMRSVGASKGTMVEADVAPGSALVGLRVDRAPFPRDAVLVSIERQDEIIVPRGDVVIEGGDRLSLFATMAGRDALLALLAGPAPQTPGAGVGPDEGPARDGASPASDQDVTPARDTSTHGSPPDRAD